MAIRLSATSRRRGYATTAIAATVVMVAAAAASAVSGIFSVGDVLRGDDPARPPGLTVDETVLATGSAPVAGRWVMTGYESEASEGQPAGLPCVRLSLMEPPRGTPITSSGVCGEVAGDFGGASLPVKDVAGSGRAELLIFGRAPEAASEVQLNADGDRKIAVPVRRGPPSDPGSRVWVMTVSSDLTRGEVEWRNEARAPSAKRLDASGYFDRLEAIKKVR